MGRNTRVHAHMAVHRHRRVHMHIAESQARSLVLQHALQCDAYACKGFIVALRLATFCPYARWLASPTTVSRTKATGCLQ